MTLYNHIRYVLLAALVVFVSLQTAAFRQCDNLMGRVTVDGKPRNGVVVSDGINVTVTDADGYYSMLTDGRQHVFLSVPSDCKVPVDANGAPAFYQTITYGPDAVARHDFSLTSVPEKKEWTLLAMADPQVAVGDTCDFERYIMPPLMEFVATLGDDVYGITLGDLVWNTPSLLGYYKKRIGSTGVPVFAVIGNHDHNEHVKDDKKSDRDFRDVFGPTYYSVNIGDCHLVVLDDICYRAEKGRNDYSDYVTPQQLVWLEKDLSYVPKDKMIIIGVHIPTARRNVPGHVSSNKPLYDLVRGFKDVQILSGHSHYNFTTTIAPNITETTFGSVMGAFWYPLCHDGSPRGYAALKFKGNRLVDKYYVGAGCDRDYQMKIYPPEDAVLWNPRRKQGEPYDSILVNIFCWHDNWTVEVSEDGRRWKRLPDEARLIPEKSGGKCWDPDVRKSLVKGRIPANHGGARPTDPNDHMFLYKPSDGWRMVSFRATDPFGNVYVSTLNNKSI